MSRPKPFTRREALKLAALATLGLPLINAAPGLHAGELGASTKNAGQTPGLKIGLAGFSLRKLPVDEAISIAQVLAVEYVSLFSSQAPVEKGTPEECRLAAEKFRAAGLTLVSTGVVNLTHDETAMRRAFDNARAAGLPMITCKPEIEALPLLERFVKEYGIVAAIHNHGPEDKIYPSPYDAWKAVQPYDTRIGLCIDVGHTMRAGVNPVEAIRKCAARLYDVHLKDSLAVPGTTKDVPIEAGRGRIDIRAILSALLKINYPRVVSYEYERIGTNLAVGLAESIGYVRGVLAGMAQ